MHFEYNLLHVAKLLISRPLSGQMLDTRKSDTFVMQHLRQLKILVVPNIQIQTVGFPTDTTYYTS